MAIQSLYPNIEPSLLLDFANVELLDPRITFTRTTTATYYNGVTTAKAEENLLLQSQDFTNASWVNSNTSDAANTDTAPDGTSTADTVTATAANGTILQTFTAVAGSYTFSVWLKRKTGTGDIQIAADSGTWTTKTITASWARYDVTQTLTAGSKTAGIRIVTDTDEVYAWGAQLEQRSSVTSYTATTTQAITNYIPVLQTAASGQARFDHNPTTGESLGLLIEEQRANLALRSDDFATTWSATRSSVVSNTIIAPDGTLTGDKLVENTDNNTHLILQSISLSDNTVYTWSSYVKAAERSWVFLTIVRKDANNLGAYFNISSETVGLTQSGATARIQSVGNGWYRCSISLDVLSGGTTPQARIWIANADNSNSYTGDGYSGIYIWGAQLEAGAFPTSYIPTTTASVTRNADAASMTGTNFSSWYRADEGSVYCEASRFGSGAGRSIWWISNNTFDNQIGNFVTATNDYRFDDTTNGVAQAAIVGAASIGFNQSVKSASAYKLNDLAVSVNSAAVVTDTSALIPVVNKLDIGANSQSASQLNGHIRKLSYYPIRCTNAQLQALTA